jgi:hypothetical protein
MIAPKYKAAHYSVNRFKLLSEIEKWFDRECGIYDDGDIYELWCYFKTKCEKDLLQLAECSDIVENRHQKILNTADFMRYCHLNIQRTIRDRIMNLKP